MIFNVQSGGTNTTDATASAADIKSGQTAYISSGKVTGEMPNGTATPAATVSGTGATISASASANTLTLTKTVSNTPSVSAGYISAGTQGNTAVTLTATTPVLDAKTYYTSTSPQVIASGTYLNGSITIASVMLSESLAQQTIKDGVRVTVGDVGASTRIFNVVGSFTDAATVSTGQTAATKDQLLSGYSAWVDGAEVKGSIANITFPTSVSGSSVGTNIAYVGGGLNTRKYINIPAGYNPEDVCYTIYGIDTCSVSTPATTITATPSISVNGSGVVSVTVSGSEDITPVLNPSSGGWVTNTASGTVTASGSGELTLDPIIVRTTITGEKTVIPTISRQEFIISGVTDAASGVATTTVPTSGVYVKVRSASSTNLITASPTLSASGFGTAGYGTFSSLSASVGASRSSDTYVPITTATLPTAAAAIAIGTSKATINRSTSVQYINIPKGFVAASGYYTIASTPTATASTPATSVAAGAISASSVTISTGTVSLTTAASTKSVTPTLNPTTGGYVTAGTAGTITVPAKTYTYQMPTRQAASTYNAVASTANRTIASGTYLTGAQTIRGIAISNTLVASNIKKGVVVTVGDTGSATRLKNITGTYEGSGGVTMTARNAGTAWDGGNTSGIGWREEKYSDGKLIRWCWDYWNANAGDGQKSIAMTATASDGSGPTAFTATPDISFGLFCNNTAVSACCTAQSWTNSSIYFFCFFTNNSSGRRLITSIRMEGRWK